MFQSARVLAAASVLLALAPTLPAQVINSISPNNACFNGPSLTLTVNGSGFITSGIGNSSAVRWNGTNIPTTYVSSSQLTATVSAGYLDVAGPASITVINQHLIAPPTISNTVTFTVNTFAQISSIGPSILCADGTSATINVYSGTILSGYSVRWNSTTLSSSYAGYQQGLGYSRVATVPASQLNWPGTASVRLRSAQGCDSDPVTVTAVFPSSISSISPTWRGLGGGTFTLTVNGVSLQPGSIVRWNGIALPTTYVSLIQLTATVDESFLGRTGSASITVSGGPCGETSSETFDIIGPSVTSISPTGIGVGASTATVTVTGSSFTTNSDVLCDGVGVTTTYISATQLTATIPASMLATHGTKWISVRNLYIGPVFAWSASKGFSVTGPTLHQLLPAHAPAGSGGFTMTLRGIGLQSTGIVPTLARWNGAAIFPTDYIDSSTLQVTIPASFIASPGTATLDVQVSVPLGVKYTNTLTFTIDPPGMSSTSSGGFTLDTGGLVYDSVVDGNTLYIGGFFDFVGPITGGQGSFSTIYGFPQEGPPPINGTVNAAVSDGAGGWFIGGSFTSVGIFARSNVAHIFANGMVDPVFTATTNGPVYDLSLSPSSTLYVAGDFSSVNYGPRHCAAAVNSTTGETTGFNPCPNGVVTSIAAEGSGFIVAVGGFGVIGGGAAQTAGLAALFPATGDLYIWNNFVSIGGTPLDVHGDGSNFYVTTSTKFAARYVFDGAVAPGWFDHTINGVVHSIAVHPSWVFIGGNFTTVDGQPRGRVAMFDKSNGVLQSLNPNANGEVWSIGHDGSHLFVGGEFTQLAGEVREKVGSVLIDFGTAGYFNPTAMNGDVSLLSVSDTRVGVFGSFNSIGGQLRKNLAALDLATRTVIPTWQADASGTVTTVGAGAGWLYVGGIFTTLDGQPRNRLGRVGLVSGNADSWNPNVNSQVNNLTVGPSSLFVNGNFSAVGGVPCDGFAEIGLATAAPTPLVLPVGIVVLATALQGSTLYVGGNLSWNSTSPSCVIAIDLTTGGLTDFAPIAVGSCTAILAAGETIFVGGGFTALNGASTTLAALRASDGSSLPFNPGIDGQVTSIMRSGATLFLSGLFNNVGGQPHPDVVALDIGSAQPRAWTPTLTQTQYPFPTVNVWGGDVHVAGQFTASGAKGLASYALGGFNPTPVLTSLGAQTAPAGSASFILSLQGSAFTSGSAARFGGVFVPTTFVSSSQLQASIDASLLTDAGVVSVDVVAPAPGAGVSAVLTFTIENPAPVAASLNPPTAPFSGPAFALAVNGSGFTTQSVVRWNGADLSTTFVGSNQLEASVAAPLLATAGPASVTVFNPTPGGGTSTALTFTVEYPAPVVGTLMPSAQLVGSSTFVLTVIGGSFYAPSVVRWDGVPLATSFVSGTELQAQIDAGMLAAAGSHAVDVESPPPGGGISGALTFLVLNPAPLVSSIAPTGVTAGDPGFTLQVAGSGFVASSVVRWNGAALATSFQNAGLLHATVTEPHLGAAGAISVAVETPVPGGGTSSSQTFTIQNPVPVAAALSPTSVIAGSPTFALTVTGSGFNSQSVVLAGGSPVSTSFMSETQLGAQIAAALIDSGGPLSIAVTNPAPGGGTSGSLALAIENPVPVLTLLNPQSIPAGGPAFLLTLTGFGFVPVSVVQWNGAPLATAFQSQSQLQATVPASKIAFGGSATVSVVNPAPGGGASNALLFDVVAPIVLSLSPSSIAPMTTGQAPLLLTINGSGFSVGSVAYANGEPLSTFYSSGSQLFATVASSLPAAQILGGLVISVLDGTAHSNGSPLRLGTGNNEGWIMKSPPDPAPGQIFSIVIEGALSAAPFSLIIDTTNPAPISPFPGPTSNEVLAIDPANPGLVFPLDAIGFGGPPQPGIAFSASGRFVISGLIQPSPAVGIGLTLQAIYPDTSSFWGFHLTWGHFAMPF